MRSIGPFIGKFSPLYHPKFFSHINKNKARYFTSFLLEMAALEMNGLNSRCQGTAYPIPPTLVCPHVHDSASMALICPIGVPVLR